MLCLRAPGSPAALLPPSSASALAETRGHEHQTPALVALIKCKVTPLCACTNQHPQPAGRGQTCETWRHRRLRVTAATRCSRAFPALPTRCWRCCRACRCQHPSAPRTPQRTREARERERLKTVRASLSWSLLSSGGL
eukprot:3454145-Rhodomonas_salina.5